MADKAFGCEKCSKQHNQRFRLARHEKTCAGDKIARYYSGGVYHPNQTPLETPQTPQTEIKEVLIFFFFFKRNVK